jgi:RluA family pseudouridine synthase
LANPKAVVLYCDDELLVVNKPASITVIPDGYDPEAACLKGILETDFGKLWIVHRLDRQTSGVLVFARTQSAHRILNEQFADRHVKKVYHALVLGRPQWDKELIDFPLFVDGDRKHRTVVNYQQGKSAVTQVKVLERFKLWALVEARPFTGRTHQIRVHLSAAGIPIVADALYGDGIPLYLSNIKKDYRKKASSERPLLSRLGLHACALTLTHPKNQSEKKFDAPYFKDMRTALNGLRKYGLTG